MLPCPPGGALIPLDGHLELADAYAHAEAAPADLRTPPLPGWGLDPELTDRYLKRMRLGTAGGVALAVGATVVSVGAVVFTVGFAECLGAAIGDSTCSDGEMVTGALLIGAGSLTAVVGEVVMFTGALGAAYDGRALGLGTSPTVGWVGVGLVGGGIAVTAVATAVDDWTASQAVGTVGNVLALGGLVCGGVQLGQVRGAGRRAGLVVVPTPNGIGVAGRLGRATPTRIGDDAPPDYK